VLTLGAHVQVADRRSLVGRLHLCGRRSSEGPYCVEHARVAYQPQQTKKKGERHQLARSLRRYI
jgi:GcrA cell cycle regulator